MSKSTQSFFPCEGMDMEQMKEEAKSMNDSLEKTRLELTTLLMEASSKTDIAKKLQKEEECKAHLEALKKLIREWKVEPRYNDFLKQQIFILKKTLV